MLRTVLKLECTGHDAVAVDYGMNHLVFHAPGHDQRRFLELFERDLAPRLRGLA